MSKPMDWQPKVGSPHAIVLYDDCNVTLKSIIFPSDRKTILPSLL